MSHVIGYARVSTLDQNPELQIDALQKAGCKKIFTDHASGSREDRLQFKACLDYLREGDTLVVWKLDRMGRSAKHLIELMEDFAKKGIVFKSLTESFDANTPMGRATFMFMCAIAQMERDVLIERTRAGLAVARKNGKKAGPKFKLSKSQLHHISALLKDPSITLDSIAEQYGIHRTTLYRTLKRHEVYSAGHGDGPNGQQLLEVR